MIVKIFKAYLAYTLCDLLCFDENKIWLLQISTNDFLSSFLIKFCLINLVLLNN